ncbi:MAG: apolipoprotein N-acyltransferase [Pseudomonadota bacterium]
MSTARRAHPERGGAERPGDAPAPRSIRAPDGWRGGGLAFLAGLLLSAGHAPIGLPFTAFIALPALAWLVAGSGWRRGAFLTWCAGTGYFMVSLHWIGHAFLVDAEAFAWAIPLVLTILPGGLALLWAVAGGAAGLVGRESMARSALVLVAGLTLIEYLRAHLFTGFPWAMPGYLWAETPLAQLTAWIGPYGLTLVTLLLTTLPGVLGHAAAERHGTRRLVYASGAVATLAAFAGLWMAGAARIEAAATPPRSEETTAPVIRLVQPNAPQHLKWQRDWAPRFYRRLLDLSASPPHPDLGPPDLVVWPETAVAFLPADFPDARQDMALAAGAPLVLGALDRAGPGDIGEGVVNALMIVTPDAEIAARYPKAHLVPFGEYVPMRWLFETIGLSLIAGRGSFAAGPAPASIAIEGVPSFAALICYEAIFPHDVSAAIAAGAEIGIERPSMILQITNDAWFGELGGPQQHLAQARLRAIEQGLPMVRAANTGVSAIIDAHGQVVGAIPLGQHGILDLGLPAAIHPPFYARNGDGMAILGAAVLFFASFFRISARKGGGDHTGSQV